MRMASSWLAQAAGRAPCAGATRRAARRSDLNCTKRAGFDALGAAQAQLPLGAPLAADVAHSQPRARACAPPLRWRHAWRRRRAMRALMRRSGCTESRAPDRSGGTGCAYGLARSVSLRRLCARTTQLLVAWLSMCVLFGSFALHWGEPVLLSLRISRALWHTAASAPSVGRAVAVRAESIATRSAGTLCLFLSHTQ
jgi:hypothetical protein